MSTLLESWPEPDPEAIRVRLRAHMGIYKISRKSLALASGISRASLAAKLDGPVEFTVPEVINVARALGVTWLWVMTGDESGGVPPHPRDGVSRTADAQAQGLLLPRQDSNLKPAGEYPAPGFAAQTAA